MVTRTGSNRPRRVGSSVVETSATPWAGTTNRARRVPACNDGASSSANHTRNARAVGFETVQVSVSCPPSGITSGRSRAKSITSGRGAIHQSARPASTSTALTARNPHPPSSAMTTIDASAATTARRLVGTGTAQRGTGTEARMPSRTPSAVAPSSSSSGRSTIRCRSAGFTTALTSSGVT
jgi:hypothetical protein